MTLIIALVMAGVLLYCLSLIQMDGAIMALIRAVVVIGCVIYVCQYLGLWRGVHLGF